MNTERHQELCRNRKASHEYEILETFELGICLQGTEIKSLRAHGGSLQEAYITDINNELWLINSTIKKYSFGSYNNHEEKRKRKLLAHRKEARRISAAIAEKGLTCIPLCMYLKGPYAKLTVALARGKKLHDKRESSKARDDRREMERELRN